MCVKEDDVKELVELIEFKLSQDVPIYEIVEDVRELIMLSEDKKMCEVQR